MIFSTQTFFGTSETLGGLAEDIFQLNTALADLMTNVEETMTFKLKFKPKQRQTNSDENHASL